MILRNKHNGASPWYDCMRLWRITVVLMLVLCALASAAKESKKVDEWAQRRLFTDRLAGEWYKIGVLHRDLDGIRDIVADIRNFEIYPQGVTRLSEDKLVILDKRIEQLEKEYSAIRQAIENLKPPLTDALAIMREMVVTAPVEDMFAILEMGDLERLNTMLDLKHRIDKLWLDADGIIASFNEGMGLPSFVQSGTDGFEADFDRIIKANLGFLSKQYFEKMNIIKDSLALRGNDAQKKAMFSAEMMQVKETYQAKQYAAARDLLTAMQRRFGTIGNQPDIEAYLCRSYFSLGEYPKSLASAKSLMGKPAYDSISWIYSLQSLYAQQNFAELWRMADSIPYDKLSPKKRNFAIWLVMESGLAVDPKADLSKLAGRVTKDASYSIHVLHALGRSYYYRNEPTVALSAYKSASSIKPREEADRHALSRVQLGIAQVQYEQKEYDKALKVYFDLLKADGSFEEALFGIIWCYIGQGDFVKAEASMKTLVNQNPRSPLAAETVLLMAQRSVARVQFEWKKIAYLDKEESRLVSLLEKIKEKIATETDSAGRSRLEDAQKDVTVLYTKITAEPRLSKIDIEDLYDHGLRVCKLVSEKYETGSFQDISFSEVREKLLHELDSVSNAIQAVDARASKFSVEQLRQNIRNIKALVRKSTVLSATIQLDHYRWETEYLDWQKTRESATDKIRRDVCAHNKTPAGIAECHSQDSAYARLMDSLVDLGETRQKKWYTQLTAVLEDILKTTLSPEDEIYLRYHLGELSYKRENENFSVAYDVYEAQRSYYEEQMRQFRENIIDKMPLAPPLPVLNHKRSIEQFRRAIALGAGDTLSAPSRYSLAWCFSDLGQFDSSIAQMQYVAENFPTSRYTPQAWMYLGEYFFDHSYLDKAIFAYQSVMKYPESDWFDEALYKLAWTQYRLSNPDKAISSFLALVDLGEGVSGKVLLQKESIDYIAISFSESDATGQKGLERATAFARKLGDEDKGTQILHRLAKVYKDQGRYDMATNTYRTLLTMYPQYRRNYLVESELLAVLERKMSLEQACDQKKKYFAKYNRESDWAKAQKNIEAVREADSAASQQLYDAAITFHQVALQNNKRDLYITAAENYESFIRHYPRSPVANECHYNLAEILFSQGEYYRAAEEYMAVSKRYPESKYRETAAWNAIVASQNLLKSEAKIR